MKSIDCFCKKWYIRTSLSIWYKYEAYDPNYTIHIFHTPNRTDINITNTQRWTQHVNVNSLYSFQQHTPFKFHLVEISQNSKTAAVAKTSNKSFPKRLSNTCKCLKVMDILRGPAKNRKLCTHSFQRLSNETILWAVLGQKEQIKWIKQSW